jgi:hypothetical protein
VPDPAAVGAPLVVRFEAATSEELYPGGAVHGESLIVANAGPQVAP